MINFKKFSREELKNVLGGPGCSIAVQESNKSWTTRKGECKQVFQNPRENSNLEIMIYLLSTVDVKIWLYLLTVNSRIFKKKHKIMRSFLFTAAFIALVSFSAFSCKSKNYITYYNKVNSIDSVYKINRDTIAFIKRYKKLFKKYNPPKSYGTFDKYETYIVFADKYSKNFGEKKSLYKLLDLVAPYNETYKTLFPLCAKYGIDSLSVEQKIASSKKNWNKRLIDSFSVAFVRDQKLGRTDSLTIVKNDRINARLLKWTIENYGYPSPQKIGMTGNDGVFMPMLTFLSHIGGDVPEYYPYFKKALLKYVKSGECSPREYATMIDRHEHENKREIIYGEYLFNFSDLKKVNRKRRSIGLKSLTHDVQR